MNQWLLLAVSGVLTLAASSAAAQTAPDLASFYPPPGDTAAPKPKLTQSIAVDSPAYCSSVRGNVTIRFKAPSMTWVKACCWQQPTAAAPGQFGHDVDLAPDLKLDAAGNASFVFHADRFPNGPINLRLYAKNPAENTQDYCELQLFNEGGVVWDQGIPKTTPPAAKGMSVVFADDFNRPLSISKDGSGTYWTHWGGGDGSVWPFAEYDSPQNPFSQVKAKATDFLRIHASKPEGSRGSTGSLTPVFKHEPPKPGAAASAPCYFECRFLAQNATGTWPAFWVCTQGGSGCDEMDVIEAYGTNAPDGGVWYPYHVTTHFWGQPEPAWVKNKTLGPDGNPFAAHKMVNPLDLAGHSAWSTTFHTYGLKVTPELTTYYLDNVPVLQHPSGKLAATQPMAFLVNLAIGGGGWHPNLTRYGNQSDMWIDYIRVYQGRK